jgi:hypothetical protein
MKISKSNKTSKFSIYIILSVIFFFALNVKESFAIITLSKIPGVPTKLIPDVLNDLIGWILGIGLMLSVTYLVWGGISYMSSSGDQQKTENAKKTVKYALLGILVIGLSYAAILVLDIIFVS